MNLQPYQTHASDFTPRPASNGTIEGSGAEDVGFRRYEASARIASHRDRQAEVSARNRRIDRDRLIAYALYFFQASSGDNLRTMYEDAGLQHTNIIDMHALLREIRSELSPIATGKA